MKLRGAIPVMAAPYHEDESLDEDGLRKQVDFAIAKGAAAVCVPDSAPSFINSPILSATAWPASYWSTRLSASR